MVHVLLKTLAFEAWGQSTASGFGEKASLDALGLGVVSDILDDHTPFTMDVLSAEGTGVGHIGGADETFTNNPVTLVELLSVVEGIIESLFLFLGDVIYQIISGLIGNVSVLLQDQRIVVDGIL